MPNQNGCARRPEIVGVRRREQEPIAGTTPVHPPGEPSVPHVVEETKRFEVACCAEGCGGLRRRLCSGWSGILFGLLLSGGLLAAIYFGTAHIQNDASVCTSIAKCGELFNDKYVCTTPQCSSTVYNLTELHEIARSRAYRKVSADLSWTGNNLTLTVNDHHDLVCTKNATGDAIYLAAERAALACIRSKIDEADTSVEYILATETALLYADEWCAVDDPGTGYCSTARCNCGPEADLSDLSFGLSTLSSRSPPSPPPPLSPQLPAKMVADHREKPLCYIEQSLGNVVLRGHV